MKYPSEQEQVVGSLPSPGIQEVHVVGFPWQVWQGLRHCPHVFWFGMSKCPGLQSQFSDNSLLLLSQFVQFSAEFSQVEHL